MRRRDFLLEWWPVIARYSGLLLGAHAAFLAAPADKAIEFAFAGGLVAVQEVVKGQRRRNRKRDADE